jgi:hypothetical protein
MQLHAFPGQDEFFPVQCSFLLLLRHVGGGGVLADQLYQIQEIYQVQSLVGTDQASVYHVQPGQLYQLDPFLLGHFLDL